MTFIRHPIRWFVFSLCMGFLGLSACTNTNQGKSIDHANYADMGSTAIALSAGAAEANPIGAVLIPLKLGMGYATEKYWADDCTERAVIAGAAGSFYYGATVNNLLVAAGSTAAIPVGVMAGLLYFTNKESIEPDTYSCIPHIEVLQDFAKAYAEGDSKAISATFTQDAHTTDSAGRMAIQADYEAFFAGVSTQSVRWRNYKDGIGSVLLEVDGERWHQDVAITYENGKISAMEW